MKSAVFVGFLGITVTTTSPLLATQGEQLMPDLLPRAEEMEIALSAAPDHLKAGAGVYVLEEGGVVQARESSNGFNCIINRDHPLNRKPTCYDAEGSETILPKVIKISNMIMEGIPMNEIWPVIQAGFESGEFIAPRRPGVAYMLTDHIRTYNGTDQFGTFPPHVMFYAPNLTNEDIGWSREAARANPSLPFIAYQGPHGFMVVR